MDKTAQVTALYSRVREILDSARANVARSVNTTQVVANWLIGCEIVEEQQRGRKRAGYGERLLEELSARLQTDYGKGFSIPSLKFFRDFYLTYTSLLNPAIGYAARSESAPPLAIGCAARSEFPPLLTIQHALCGEFTPTTGKEVLFNKPWQPGQLHPNLSWTHYRTLLRVAKTDARAFYEIEAIGNNWSARELERQINSLLYERLALSKDKSGLMRLAKKGQEILQPADVFKDPVFDKNDAVVKYTLGPDQSREIFASRYKLYLPSEEELREEIRREVRRFPSRQPSPPTRRKAKKP